MQRLDAKVGCIEAGSQRLDMQRLDTEFGR